MSRKAPAVRQYMTHLPVESERCQTVADAEALMREHQIRHLPVMSGSHLKGVVSYHGLLEGRVRHGDALDQMLLEDVCQENALQVSPVTPINEVVGEMLASHVDSAVVVDAGYVVGMFTTTDALKALQTMLS